MIINKKDIRNIKVLTLVVLIVLIALIVLNKIGKNKNQKLAMESLLSDIKILGLDAPNEESTAPVFIYSSLSEDIIEKILGVSWKENAPVKLEELSCIYVTYWGFDEIEHVGEMIVHKKIAQEVTEIFKELYEARFPIEKIMLIDEYDANDDLSMADNNSSAFCSREVTGKKGVFSQHSYGAAIDINPIQNPYIKGDIILPEEGSIYIDRSNVRKGMIIKGDVCYNAFKSRGWIWGGEWSSLKDYQHFQKKIDFD